jgi:hypothetical protein
MEAVGAVRNRTKVKRRKAGRSWVSWLLSAKPNIRRTIAGSGDGFARSSVILTRGDLSASAALEARAVALKERKDRYGEGTREVG